jgi:hypothetical protein
MEVIIASPGEVIADGSSRAALSQVQAYLVFVAEGTFCDFAKFRRLVFYGLTEFDVPRWAEYAV